MARIRPYAPSDHAALASICLRTADAGADATGLLADDAIWANLFVLPYVVRDPGLAWVLESDDGHAAGYLVATDDTDAFEAWFRESWWRGFARRWPEPAEGRTRQDELLRYAFRRGTEPDPFAAEYPAHLHIDLLAAVRGEGWGRRLMELLARRLTERGVRGVQVGVLDTNDAAQAFYERLGYDALTREPGVVVLGRRL